MAKQTDTSAANQYSERVNAAIDWISQHLDEPISLKDVAAVAKFSPFHFHRIFRTITSETLTAFVTRLRLERALVLMRAAPGKSLTAIALETGFASSSNFSRVFKARYGVSPAKANLRELIEGCKIRQAAEASRYYDSAVPHHVAAPERLVPRVRIERWAEIRLAYVRVIGGYLNPQSLIDGYHAIEAWAERHGVDRASSRLIGMSMDDPDVVPLSRCRYDFCRTVTSRPAPRSGANYATIPACDWAVADCTGDMREVEHVWNYLFRDWLPKSGWQPAAIPALEVFKKRPEEIGWDRFDMICCVPIEPLR